MIDDGTLFKLNQDRYRLVCGIWLREQAHKLELHRVWIKTSTDQIHNVSIQGPKSRDLLKSLNIRTTSQRPTISELKWFRFTIGKMDNLDGTCEIPLLISRTGYTGELGYEIWCHPSNSVKLWEKIWLNGQNPMFNLKPLGLLALDILRIEAGLIFFEYEFDEQTDPIEAGIEFAIDFAKQENFIGKQTLIKRKEYQRQKLVGLELHCNGGSEIGSHGDCVHLENSRQQIGIVTSGCKSPILNKSIALARISAEHSQVGNRVEIGKLDGYQKRIKATIVKYPFYDPEKTKLRS
ncbi:unnamed protein product [Didymodactylos carnosus]|uniref:Aminomethyltransferase n=1 Tax=Didymodactylos carnosus TaxID=1234261 RepID=A0A814UUQ0_9BILA|nr:unnamed protein product [Didymodactylos carnosus]CAF1179089.1 unnamed protein product [Didymodactylos carnosus]CAF3773426.1 unnamed protein product [Didymodactylos carnosus]CAF3943308.1 unnamed protein product [Didymodactylos carnosus]